MSGRCRSCDTILTEADMVRKFPADKDGKQHYAELCSNCYEETMDIYFDRYQDPLQDLDIIQYGATYD